MLPERTLGSTPMLNIAIATLAGVLAGMLGLLPFLHTNLVLELISHPPGEVGAAYILALSFSHAAFELIPAVFVGIPSLAIAAGVLPAHQLALQGKGRQALGAMLDALLVSGVLAILLLPLALVLLPPLYQLIRPLTFFLLLLIVGALVHSEHTLPNKSIALVVVALSGLVGHLLLGQRGEEPSVLFALLTGLFGIPGLLASLKSASLPLGIPQPESPRPFLRWVLAGTIGGLLSSLLPAVSATMLSGLLLAGMEREPRTFLAVNSALTGSRIVFDAVATQTLGKARSASAVAFQQVMVGSDAQALGTVLVAGLLALTLAVVLTRALTTITLQPLARIQDKGWLSPVLFATIVVGITVQTGWPGLVACACGAAIGALPVLTGVKRVHAMGCLVVPTLHYTAPSFPPVGL